MNGQIKKRHNVHTLFRIMTYIRSYMPLVLLSMFFALVTVVLTLYAPILIGKSIDFIIGKGTVDFEDLVPLLVKLGIIVCITSLAQWLMDLCNNIVTYHIVKDIRSKAFRHLHNLSIRYMDSHPNGDIISRIVSDTEQFSEGLLMGFTQLFTGIITILGTLFFMLFINYKIAFLVVCLTPLSLLVANFIAKRTYKMFQAQAIAKADITDLIDEMVGNQKIIQAFEYEKEAQQRFKPLNQDLRDCSLRAIFFSSLTNPSTRFINGLVYTGVGVLGAFLSINGALSIGQLSSFLSYANQYTKPFNEISGFITELQNALACAARVFDLIDEQPQIPDRSDAMILDHADGTVSLDHVFFSYQKDISLIEDFNLAVKPGQRIAIVGPTGCGKSTIINLLMRFYDTDSGDIKVDQIPVTQLTRDSLRRNYGMVLQETWLKSGTIRDNICYGRPDASDEEMIEAAKAAHAHSFIMRMPKGYDSFISEDGGNLSQGQKQLLCIARVMLCLPPMLILDEATSSIDTRTEIRIQKAFAHMMEGRTSFIVAHRLSTIQEADVILVMKQGKIMEQGTHEELLSQKGFYSKLYYSQFHTE